MRIAACLLVLLFSAAAEARTLVVNPALQAANDANAGTEEKPLRTIGRAAALVEPGDVVRIWPGVYRERVVIARSGTKEHPIRFEAAQGGPALVTGADLMTGWSRESDGAYSIPWRHRLYQGDDHNPGGVEQVFSAGSLLRKVAGRQELAVGAFFIDEDAQRLYLRSGGNPDESREARPVEASTRAGVWIVKGAYVETCGLGFRYAANRAQQAMASFEGDHDRIEDCAFTWSNSTGASFRGDDITVRRCEFADNGQQGFTAIFAKRLLFDGCTVERNNIKNYPRGWEAGGDKLVLTRGVIIEYSRFLKNHGNGIWFDISNVDGEVRNCLIADNEDAGIFCEISYGLHAHDNVLVGNGLARSEGAWGANGGICISSSPGCMVQRNLICGNQQGFCFREQNRSTVPVDDEKGAEVPIWNHDEVIRDNLIVYNRTAQVQGWFDIEGDRHWPRAMQPGHSAGKPKHDVAAAYHKRKDGVPPGLRLEDLKITFQDNVYSLQPEQPFFLWGADWKYKEKFADLASLNRALGFERRADHMLTEFPVDVARRDFRLTQAVMSLVEHAYPRGPVPDCALGLK